MPQLQLTQNRPQSGRTSRARDRGTPHDRKHRSEKHLGTKRQSAEEEPFYLKLSDGRRQPQRMQSQPKQQLQPIDLMKRVLQQHYSSQIAQKQQQKQISLKKKIMEERDYLSHFSKHQQIQAKHQQQQLSQHHSHLRQQIHKRQILVQSIKTEELQSSRSYQPRSLNLLHKAESFRQFYEQAYLARQLAAKQYEVYMKYQDKRNREKLLNLNSNPETHNHQNFQQRIRQQQKEGLRAALDRQIAERKAGLKLGAYWK